MKNKFFQKIADEMTEGTDLHIKIKKLDKGTFHEILKQAFLKLAGKPFNFDQNLILKIQASGALVRRDGGVPQEQDIQNMIQHLTLIKV